MSESLTRPPLGCYRDAVTELLEAGSPLSEIEQAIALLPGLDENERSALWLFAFFSRDRGRGSPKRRPRLTVVS